MIWHVSIQKLIWNVGLKLFLFKQKNSKPSTTSFVLTWLAGLSLLVWLGNLCWKDLWEINHEIKSLWGIFIKGSPRRDNTGKRPIHLIPSVIQQSDTKLLVTRPTHANCLYSWPKTAQLLHWRRQIIKRLICLFNIIILLHSKLEETSFVYGEWHLSYDASPSNRTKFWSNFRIVQVITRRIKA